MGEADAAESSKGSRYDAHGRMAIIEEILSAMLLTMVAAWFFAMFWVYV